MTLLQLLRIYLIIFLICMNSMLANTNFTYNINALWNLQEMCECKLNYSALVYNNYGCWFIYSNFLFNILPFSGVELGEVANQSTKLTGKIFEVLYIKVISNLVVVWNTIIAMITQ